MVNALEQETEVSVKSVLKIITGTNNDEKTLLYAMDYHNEQMKALVGREYAKSTYDKYIYTTNYQYIYITYISVNRLPTQRFMGLLATTTVT